jgi:glycosyltransferase involved in cell wall biosynthesis
VISEALVSGLPVIASRIIGTVGLLGPDYPGYCPASDTEALGALLWRAEQDPDFLARLRQVCAVRADLFRPERENASLDRLIRDLTEKPRAGDAAPEADPTQPAP